MKKVIPVLLLFLILIGILVVSAKKNWGQENAVNIIENIEAPKFKLLMASKKVQLVDVRTPEEWSEGTLPDALKINLFSDSFLEEINLLDKEIPIFVYCKAGGRSMRAAEKMKNAGFSKIYNLSGGIGSWKKHGFKTAK